MPATLLAGEAITSISFDMANCYLLRSRDGFVLVDTGLPRNRTRIDHAIEAAGCRPGDLRLIVLTHGDYDHAGNATYLREAFGGVIGIHADDAERVRRGDWQWGFKSKPDRFLPLFRIVGQVVRPGAFRTFEPNVLLEDGQDLASYGYDGRILALPGHTRGSIGVVSADGDVFCGDLLGNFFGGPDLEFFIDDLPAAHASVERLRSMGIRMIYPGHGKPFPLSALKVAT
ncbi:MAG TPA: MBL fold metallo-hydrolase [Candidatus Limnocylindrales bacterium]|nr:MBL fold metallo-hydrolase [Candidatus Limnocylindrales bacterium]